MSFNLEVKRDLCAVKKGMRPCCHKALLLGALLFAARVEVKRILLYTEERAYSDLLTASLWKNAGVSAEASATGKRFTLRLQNSEDLQKIAVALPLIYDAGTPRIDRAFIHKPCCVGAFLRGAFLSCGWVGEPDRGFQMAFSTRYARLREDLFALLCDLGFAPAFTVRRGEEVIYFKRADQIEDILHQMGATMAAFTLSEQVVERDVRNLINRKVNCETANITKTVYAAMRQIEAIERLKALGLFEGLSPDMMAVAAARLDNPEGSIAELAESLGDGATRSSVHRRLYKMIALAGEKPNEGRGA